MVKLNEDCYGAKVGSNIVVTIDEDNYKSFYVGNSIKVNYDGKDHIRKVRDFPEDVGITVKGYPVFYSDFNFIEDKDFDDWRDNFDGMNFDDWYQFDRKSLKEDAIDYSSMFDKSKDIFTKGDFSKFRLPDDGLDLDDIEDDQTDLEECWQMLATMYDDVWPDEIVDDILKTKVFWREGFIKSSKGAMLGSTRLSSNGSLTVLISTITDELDDIGFYNVLLHEMCHVASYLTTNDLDNSHSKGWKKFADKCNSKIEFLKECPITATCDIDKF